MATEAEGEKSLTTDFTDYGFGKGFLSRRSPLIYHATVPSE
jgi:hypothetical protein